MELTNERRNEDASSLKTLSHLNGHNVATAATDDKRAIDFLQRVIAQDALGESANIFKEHCLSLTVGTDDSMVEA